MDVTQLDQQEEIEMRTKRRDGSWSSRPIWVVVVDGDAYVRSYKGDAGAWYRRAQADRRGEIGVDGDIVPVELEPVADEDLNRRISDAYRDKYGGRSPESTESMLTPEVSGTTLRLTPQE